MAVAAHGGRLISSTGSTRSAPSSSASTSYSPSRTAMSPALRRRKLPRPRRGDAREARRPAEQR